MISSFLDQKDKVKVIGVKTLCGRPIGRITILVRPSVPYGLVTRKQINRNVEKMAYTQGNPGHL